MIQKELKKLSRRELVDIIYQMKKNEQQMQEEIASLQDALQDKRIKIAESGSIAEAATDITEIFSTAQVTADLYLQEIACLKRDTEEECKAMIQEAGKRVEEIIAYGEQLLSDVNERYQAADRRIQALREEACRLERRKPF